MNYKAGDCFMVNGAVLRGHMMVLLKEESAWYYFIDTLTGAIARVSYNDFETALNTKCNHPVHEELHVLEFMEHLPEKVFEVVEVNAKRFMTEGNIKRENFLWGDSVSHENRSTTPSLH